MPSANQNSALCKLQPFKHMKDAIYEKDEHFATGSKLLHDYYRKFKYSERSKKGWKTRKINKKKRKRSSKKKKPLRNRQRRK